MRRVEGHWLTGADYLHRPGRACAMPRPGNALDSHGLEQPPGRDGS